jgi:glycosyltransferase involved in cell wall biosynthesis
VIHEGVDTSRFKPDPDAVLRLRNGRSLSRSQPVITYSARNLEPYRGFHSFMRAVADICRRRTDCQIVVAGGDEVSYSAIRSHETYRERMIREVGIDPERVHFVGTLPLDDYVKLLQISSVHIYLTVPFVLSWSLLEAMATGCVIVGSNTAPVREVLTHAHNGLLVDFFSPREIADMVDRVLDHPNRGQPLGLQARADVVGSFDVTQSVRHYQELFEQLLANARCMRGAA